MCVGSRSRASQATKMPSKDEHLAKEHRNKWLERGLRVVHTHPEWAITVTFYRALHLVDAALAVHDTHPRTHKQRNLAVNRLMAPISADYIDLKDLSIVARYDPHGRVGWSEYGRARGLASAVETHVRALLPR